jgi:hypothetical protein
LGIRFLTVRVEKRTYSLPRTSPLRTSSLEMILIHINNTFAVEEWEADVVLKSPFYLVQNNEKGGETYL